MSELLIAGIPGLVEDVHLYDFTESTSASKYPLAVDPHKLTSDVTKTTLSLGSAEIGTGHDNFLNGYRVSFDLILTNKAWIEAERYHFLDFVSSQSTMHCITKFDIVNQCDSHVDLRVLRVLQEKINRYDNIQKHRNLWASEDIEDAYLDILMNVPAGFKLRARITTNYRQLKTIWTQRKTHRLPEWRTLCKWMYDNLPYFREFVERGKREEQILLVGYAVFDDDDNSIRGPLTGRLLYETKGNAEGAIAKSGETQRKAIKVKIVEVRE